MSVNKDLKVIRKEELRTLVFGEGVARFYMEEGDFKCGTWTLPSGKMGGVDDPHPNGEIFFIMEGRMIVHCPDIDQFAEAEAGEALWVPGGQRHALYNDGEDKAVAFFVIL